MKIFKDILVCLSLIACSVLTLSLIRLVRDTDATVKEVPAEITDIKLRTLAEIDSTRNDLLATVNTQATAIRQTADHRLASLQVTADNRLASIQQMVDERTGQALLMVDSTSKGALDQLSHINQGLQPVLANAAASINPKDIQGTVRDTRFLMARAARTAGHIEQMSDAIQKATPEVTQSVVSIGKSADSIAADAKREADDLTKPKHWYDRILGPVYTVGRLVAAFL